MITYSLGCELGRERREEVLAVVKEHALLRGKFTLSSGQETRYYWDGKMATTLPKAAYLIGKEIFELLKDSDINAVGGLAIGADLMVPAIAIVSYLEGTPIPAFVIRDRRKEHGTKKLIEGQFPKERGARVAIVDDIITTGTSIFKAIEEVQNEGCKIVKVVVLLDRHQGGSDKLKIEGYDFAAILHSDASGEITIEEPTTVAGQSAGGAIRK